MPSTTTTIKTSQKVDHHVRGKSPAQLHHDRACAALELSCDEQPGHPCCNYDQVAILVITFYARCSKRLDQRFPIIFSIVATSVVNVVTEAVATSVKN